MAPHKGGVTNEHRPPIVALSQKREASTIDFLRWLRRTVREAGTVGAASSRPLINGLRCRALRNVKNQIRRQHMLVGSGCAQHHEPSTVLQPMGYKTPVRDSSSTLHDSLRGVSCHYVLQPLDIFLDMNFSCETLSRDPQ